MTNFELQLEAAISTYAELSGMERADIFAACADMASQTAHNVMLLMAAAA